MEDRCDGVGGGLGGVAYPVGGRLFLGSGGGSGGRDNIDYDNPPGGAGGSIRISAELAQVELDVRGGKGRHGFDGSWGTAGTARWAPSSDGGGGTVVQTAHCDCPV